MEVNCAAIPEELIESELFGHVKGSFTGATEDKIGKFQKADGGTLFLDEIGDMSLRTQSKVLARPRRAALRTRGFQSDRDRGRARDRRHQQESRTGNCARRISPGSFLPPERNSLFRAAACASAWKIFPRSRAIF